MNDESVKPEAVSRAEARLRLAAIADSTDDAIVGKDLSGIVTAWNPGAEAMFGYRAQDIVGRPITLIIPPDRLAEEAAILAKVGQGVRIRHLETERMHRSGRRIPVSLTISPIRDDFGRIIGISKIAHDLTTRRSQANLLRAIMATLPDALVVTDAEGTIESFNEAAERMFGYRSSEVRGKDISILHASATDARPLMLDSLARSVHRHGAPQVITAKRKDGGTFPIELVVREVNLPDRRLFVRWGRDLTVRQAHERRFAELQAELVHVARVSELGQMASMLAHELSQPLAAMANYRGALRRLLGAGKVTEAQAVVERIAEQAERAHRMIGRLRALIGKGEAIRKPESLRECIDEASALALVGYGAGLELTVAVADDAAVAPIDRIQVQQVLLNLMRNAVEAMKDSPRRALSVKTVRVGDRIEVCVTDSGPGLAPRVRERLFQPFVTTKSAGLGIGLSVCEKIIKAHGGEITASGAPGGGTTFRFTLPIVATPRSGTEPTNARSIPRRD